jgi:peptidoglycan/LPS O-acetylase OafA/YrhL
MKYYSHIDGLRAISVLFILFYHAGFDSFRYGFIGVDIFFVISGFLITSSIIDDQKFSFSNFYERRVRRILPALFIMCCMSTIFASFLLTPKELKDYGRSLFSSTNMVSNFYFWKTQNYHGLLSIYKPLIHTWSLSIEEQFYIFFPLLLIFIRRYRYQLSIIFTLALSSLSLQLLVFFLNMEAVAFYFPICRAWELLFGATGAIFQKKYSVNKNDIYNSFICVIGISLILLSALFPFDYPSIIQNIIASIGTILVILYSDDENLIGKLLSNKLLCIIGVYSFSIYLYHQPIFAYFRSHFPYISNSNYAGLIVLSIILGALSFNLIEIPFKRMGKNYLYKTLFFIWALLSFSGLLFHLYDGFPNRYSTENQKILNYENYDYANVLRSQICLRTETQNFLSYPIECYGNPQGKSTTVIWGDSHAAGLYYGFSNIRQNVAQFTSTGCPPYFNDVYNSKQCNAINTWILNEIEKLKPKEVFLHAYWSFYNPKSLISLTITIDEIKRLSPNSNITIIGNTPYWHPSLPIFIAKYSNSLDLEQEFLPFQITSSKNSDNLLESMASKLNVNFISALDLLCIKDNCIYKIKDEENSRLIFYDSDHLTKEGSLYLSKKILNN